VDREIERKLPCNNICANLKRFKTLYGDKSSKRTYYPAALLRFAKHFLPFLLKLE
jgi:hypothetical protein